LAALVILWATAAYLVGHELNRSLDASLRQRALAVAELAISDPAVLTQPGALENPTSPRELGVEVVDARGRILARSLGLGNVLLPRDRLAERVLRRGTTGFEDVDLAGRAYRVYAAPIPDAGGPAAGGAVLVASATADIATTVHRLQVVLALTGLVIALLTAITAAWLAARVTRPLRRLAASAQEIEATADPGRRLPDGGRRDEVGALTRVLNGMLASLARAREGERRFLADASHELRTPVTSLLGNAEYISRHGPEPGVLDDLRGDAVRLARLVDDLLVLERTDAGGADLSRIQLDELVGSELAERDDDRIRLTRLDRTEVMGDPAGLRRALTNLVENAERHGPIGGAVTVSLEQTPPCARLSVADRGLGPAPEERDRVFERFWRGTAAAGRPGSGLGLSIVASVAARHGGRVEVDGAAFTLVLPLADASETS
jgi:signal transduction histidine kinase